MKRKHYGLLAFAVMVLSLGAVVVDAFQSLRNDTRVSPSLRLKPVVVVSAPGSNTLKEIDRLHTELASLARPRGPDTSEVNLTLFGYESQRRQERGAVSREGRLPPGMRYSISLAFSAAAKGFCVVDGTFCQEGSVLSDGAQIVKVEPRRVLVKKDSFEHWIPVTKGIKLQDRNERNAGEQK